MFAWINFQRPASVESTGDCLYKPSYGPEQNRPNLFNAEILFADVNCEFSVDNY